MRMKNTIVSALLTVAVFGGAGAGRAEGPVQVAQKAPVAPRARKTAPKPEAPKPIPVPTTAPAPAPVPTPVPIPAPALPPGPPDGAALYLRHCAGCHGQAMRGNPASRIQGAIARDVAGMGSLRFLTPAQIEAISRY